MSFPPGATLKPTQFVAHIDDKKLSDFRTLLELSPIGPPTYENSTRLDGQYGIGRQWLMDMKDTWLNRYDWRKTEDRINSFPNYTVSIKARDGDVYTVHFLAVLSENPKAAPVCLLHGWPGSFIEFLSFLDMARSKYSPKDLPYHYIVPSLPGYAYSSGPSVKKEWNNEDIAFVMNELMVGLGFSGYIAHGGDIGSFISRILAVSYDACKAIHLNFCLTAEEPKGVNAADVAEEEKKNLNRLVAFGTTGNAYAKEHGTKGGTIGLALSSSPLALLCWIGEKYIEWTDQTPSAQDILDSVMLYWVTDTFRRCIYPYIDFFGRGDSSTVFHPHPDWYCKKPIGYSYFPYELGPVPLAWAKTTGNIVWHRAHQAGGHFAAIEKPKELFEDQEEFISSLKSSDEHSEIT
ncbi:alpha/beta-hydrolase [Cadophora sp. DSE1049]|nr:alpha/beta-hydrolase [Cadophora sp. DSE1049]